MSAPVPHTCSIIDSVIEEIKSAQKDITDANENFDSLTPNELKDKLKDATHKLDSLYGSSWSEIEEIRTANEKLRDWGNDLEDKVESLNIEKEDLQDEIKRLQSELSDLESAYKDAQYELTQRY